MMAATGFGNGFRCALALSLSCLLVTPPVSGAAQAPAPKKLNIVIVGGEGAINNIRQRIAREPIVQVEDENHHPVAGATVIFLLPDSGPSGVFPDGNNSLTVMTDKNGRAVARGLRANDKAGKFQIKVHASYQTVETDATINQANAVLTTAAAAGGVSGKLIAILAIAGGAAAAAVVAATSGGNDNNGPAPPQPTTIQPGTPSVGHP